MARKRGNHWQGDAFYQGKRIRRSFPTQAEAEKWEASIARAEAEGIPLDVNDHDMTFGRFIEKYYQYLWGNSRNPKAMRSLVDRAVEGLGADVKLSQITEATIANLIAKLRAEGNAPGTINRKITSISKALKYARRLKLIDDVPYIKKLPEPEGRTRFLSRGEEEVLLRAFLHFGLEEAHDIVRVLLYTGARKSEVLKLTWRDLELYGPHPQATFWVTKNGRPRTVPLVGPALEALRERRKQAAELPDPLPSSWVFRLTGNQLQDQWDRVRAYMGMSDDPQFVIHILRHTCASRLVQGGIDMRRVQVWMGHQSITTTMRYAHFAPRDLDVAAEALLRA